MLLHARENTEAGSNKPPGNQEKGTFLQITKPPVTMNEHAERANTGTLRKNRYPV
jgi:hypothetical protein